MTFTFGKPERGDVFAFIPTIGVQRIKDFCGETTYAIGLWWGQFAVGVEWTR